ncbi:malonyl-[acyl-carrier protein] O-methyltransferase BioC [Motiliproteus sp. MSK22-1]|nr:malonyl-[acyl-carrier protein] O-methyltransferase BioC [Motiliproteus sp. MSK22-1]
MGAGTLKKIQIADSFSRAAQSYDSMAGLQRQVGHNLLQRSGLQLSGQVVDLGCGTGFFSPQLLEQARVSNVVAIDLAEGMLKFAKSSRLNSNISWLCADAEFLPLADNSVDSLFTSLSIQWCENLSALFAELARVLKPGAVLAFATLGPDTLYELRDSWAQVDDFVHVNQFQGAAAHTQGLGSYFDQLSFTEERIELEYTELKQLTDELKGIGAHNLNSGRITGLSGRQRIQTFKRAYEGFRKSNGMLPATYQVYYGIYRTL